MDFKRAREILGIEIKDRDHYLGDNRIYRFVLFLFENNVSEADKFMTSDYGGYTEGELNSIKYQIQRNKNVYQRQKLERA